jgi:hypothetical protein
MMRSGSGLVGALPYLKVSVGVSSHFSQLPVEPTRVTLLTFDGDDGPLGTSVSALPDADIDDGTPK